jgi:phospholipase/carboxylesterase
MRAWYDIVAFDGQPPQDQEGIADSRRGVERLIEREGERGVGPERIVLAGFSQGGAMALYTGLRLEQELAGIMGLSTYLMMSATLAEERAAENTRTPVFMGHGVYDPVVPLMAGQHAARTLAALDYEVEWHDYPMPHAVCPEEIDHIGAWLARRVGS